MGKDKDIPIAYIEEVNPPRKKGEFYPVKVSCPFCGLVHIHGVEPEVVNGGAKTHMGAHCKKGKPPFGYYVMMRKK